MDPEALGRLADDLAANGLYQPIGLRGPSPEGEFEIVWGDRRYAAAKLLQWDTIAARVCPWDTDPLTARAGENLQREQLTPLEEALMVRELLDSGAPIPEIERRFRRSRAWVESRLELLRLPEDLRRAVHEGRLAMGVAGVLAGIDHAEYRASLIREAENTGASLKTVNVWAAHYHADRERIVSNHLTVQEIASARSAYVIYFKCEACGADVDYRETVSLRFCTKDARELLAMLEAARVEASAGAPGPH